MMIRTELRPRIVKLARLPWSDILSHSSSLLTRIAILTKTCEDQAVWVERGDDCVMRQPWWGFQTTQTPIELVGAGSARYSQELFSPRLGASTYISRSFKGTASGLDRSIKGKPHNSCTTRYQITSQDSDRNHHDALPVRRLDPHADQQPHAPLQRPQAPQRRNHRVRPSPTVPRHIPFPPSHLLRITDKPQEAPSTTLSTKASSSPTPP